MTPLARIQAIGARQVGVTAVALMIGLTLALFHQAEQYVPASLPPPSDADLNFRYRQIMEDLYQSLLARFYRALDVRVTALDPLGRGDIESRDVVIVVHTRVQAPRRLEDSLVEHVKQGGRLIVFAEGELDLLQRFGVQTSPLAGSEKVARAVTATVEGMHVAAAYADHARVVRGVDRPIVPLLTVDGKVIAGFTGFGKGIVEVIGAPIADADFIERADNPIFLANLVLGDPRGMHHDSTPYVRVLDLEPEIVSRINALEIEKTRRAQEARRLWKYDSLWSLIQVNPVSPAMIQILLGLAVFAFSRARRLGPPLPERIHQPTLPGVMMAQAGLWQRHSTSEVAVASTVAHGSRRLRELLGLRPEVDSTQVAAAVKVAAPRLSADVDAFQKMAQHHVNSRPVDVPNQLAALWRHIDRIEKELMRRGREGA